MQHLQRSLGWLLDQLFPPACPLCSTTFPVNWSQPFCSNCLAGFIPLPPAHCPRCALPFIAGSGSSHLCGRCSIKLPPFHKVHCVGLYDRSLRKSIHQLKFNQKVGLDRPLARLLNRQLANSGGFDLVVPVPLSRQRLQQRSFNQSLLLARETGRLLQVPVAASLLLKHRDTAAQQGLSARQRELNLRGAFRLLRPLQGEKILLVDDVMTTGATVSTVSRVLLQAGAARVEVAVVGRAASGASAMLENDTS